ncbi:MAG: 4Fe-4S binding protein [Anaerolineae bacterium]|nr:4Fe-4S binding protein [Anaerolineae bacterium]
MKIRINEDRCAGCGNCLEVCPSGALSLKNDVAVVDYTLCTQCQACIDVCPVGAITAVKDTAMIVQQPAEIYNAAESRPVATRSQPWLASALVLAGQAILPRLADALIVAVERKLTQPTTTTMGTASTPSPRFAARGGRGMQRRARRRGLGNRNRR